MELEQPRQLVAADEAGTMPYPVALTGAPAHVREVVDWVRGG